MHGTYNCSQQPDVVDTISRDNYPGDSLQRHSRSTAHIGQHPLQRSASAAVPVRRDLAPPQQKRTSSLRTRSEVLQTINDSPPLQPDILGPEDGVVVLGREGLAFASYVTRYRVDRGDQMKRASAESRVGGCSPCCASTAKQTPTKFVLRCLISEAFLLSTKVMVMVMGIIRVLLISHSDHVFHSVVSSLEMIVTCSNILARFGLIRAIYNELSADLARVDLGDDGSSGSDLRHRQWSYAALTALSILFNIAAYVILHLTQQQPWTLLSNVLLLVAFTTLSRMLASQMQSLRHRILEDHVRVALHEGALLLREGLKLYRPVERKEHGVRADCFLSALQSTRFFRKPSYIHFLKQHHKERENAEPETSC
ncbi:hypothetical protein CAPTEDRAFT_196459 [Capitella teleta]|uniref:Uncharacterized protein n=1 Tax=Capitella teleta TaxID=283909 RepID=R7V0T1_CAPTE|nr:hypothetical protein CAPTEDRAFT_196459 [Capitella teleta]|eukprot:ELU12448.1 hypothetical protein CAPTEDRAFT_196459 [Capitella teleta]